MRTPRQPVFESLESRTLLSGNVAAVLVGGVLTLTGDANGNAIILTRNGNTVTITPDAGTSVKGGLAGAAVNLLGVTGAVNVNMGGGNDTLTIGGQVVGGVTQPFAVGGGSADLTIDLGDGNDQLLLAGVRARNVSINTGGGANGVTVTALNPDGVAGGPLDARTTLGGSLTVQGGSGDDAVNLRGIAVARDVTLNLGNGGNVARIATLKGGDANFDVTIGGNFAFDSSLALKSNTVTFDDPDNVGSIAIGGSVKITLGLMNDVASVSSAAGLTVGGTMFINGCYGADTIALSGARVNGILVINSGEGNDAVSVSNVSVGLAQWIDGQLVAPRVPAAYSSLLSGLALQISQLLRIC